MRRLLPVLAAFLLLALTLPACRPSEPLAPVEPYIELLSPASNSIFSDSEVTVKTWVENLTLVDKVGQPNVPGEGHLIYYLDAMPPVMTGLTATPTSGTFVYSTEITHTWTGLAAGDHILAVQLVNNDNTPVRAPSAVYAYITIK